MKKIFLTAIVLASAMCANAEDVLSIVPFKTTTAAVTSVYDDDEEEFTEGEYFSVNMNYSKDYVAVEFDFYVPQGIFSFYPDDSVQPGVLTPTSKSGMRHSAQVDVAGAAEPMAGYDVFKCMVYNTGSKVYYLNDGESGDELIKIYYNKKALAEGVYPIYMKNVSLSQGPGKTLIIPDVMSYFVVGNPTDKELKAKGVICDFVNEALAKETAISTLDLSNVTAVDGEFTYVAGRDVVAPSATVSAKVKYVAPAPATKYSTLCLPVEANIDCYVYDRKEGNYAIFKEATVAPANTPVIIAKAVATDAANATIVAATTKEITSGAYLKGDEIHTVNGNAYIRPFRGYWNEIALSNCRIAFEGPTGIQYIGTAADIENVYDLQGRQAQNTKTGVYVVNGKKQFVK